MGTPDTLAPLLAALLERQGLKERLRPYRIWPLWPKAVGPQIAQQAQPLRCRDGVLEVRVSHPVWMQQLQLMKPQLLQRINQLIGEEAIRDIYFRRGPTNPPTATQSSPGGRQPWQQSPLSARDRNEIAQAIGAARDPEVRALLQQLLQKQRRLDHYRHSD